MSEQVHPQEVRARPRAVGRDADAYEVWRPETADPGERDRAQALGAAVRERRQARHLTQRDLAREAAISERHLQRLERGERLTRRSTLERLARALEPDDAAAQALLEILVGVAANALAAETDHPRRVERRRVRRQARVERNQHELMSVARVPLVSGDTLERRISDKPGAGNGRRKSISYVIVPDGAGDEVEIDPTPDVLAAFRKVPVRWSRPNG